MKLSDMGARASRDVQDGAVKSILMASMVGAVMLVAVPVEAKAPACATSAEYSKVRKGQSVARVRQLFGGREGWNYAFGSSSSKSWTKCGARERYAQVDFRRGKVTAKRWTS